MAYKADTRRTETRKYLNLLEEADKSWKQLVKFGMKPSDAHKKAGISYALSK